MDVTVVVATFGDPSWQRLGEDRALPSVEALGVPAIAAHGANLHDARNHGLALVDTEYVCHLDADDELEPGYFDAMSTGTADLRAPAVRYVKGRHAHRPYVPKVAGHDHACTAGCLAFGNWLVVGSVARTSIVRSVGGWRDFPVYEDWDLWVRCWKAGATIEAVPEAVYRAHVRPDSRNRGQTQRFKHEAHQAIARANEIPVPA